MIPILYLNSATSTNDEIIEILKANPVPQAVFTFHQTQGRGQYGNRWNSIPSKNIAYSLALQADSVKLSENIFNYHTAIILRDFIANLTDNPVKIKWPNDLILHQKKISGMLIEKQKIHEKWFYIVGIGINILQDDFTGLPKAGSILTQTGKTMDLDIFATKLHQEISDNILCERNPHQVLSIFNQHLFRKDIVSLFEKEKKRQNGIILNADENGFLWINLEYEGEKKFYHKEIELLY